jgi:hypothetical protein
MSQDTVKKNLLKLYDCKEEYTVIFSGKRSGKVNGIYRPATKEIIIHNRNFHGSGGINENAIMYTAIHELAHHIQFTEYGKKSARTHTALFYSIMHDLADIAEKKGLYKTILDSDTERLVEEARDLSCEIAKLQKKLGEVLSRIHQYCLDNGIRYEDIVERKVQIHRNTAVKANKAFKVNLPENIGADLQEVILNEKDQAVQSAMVKASQKGKSVDQVKRTKTAPVDNEDETVSLIKEKSRLERTIKTLTRRLEEVAEQLISRGET